MRGQLYSSGWTGAGGRGRQGGRDHHGRRRSFCILQRTKIEARYFLLPPSPLTHSLVPQRRDWPRSPRPSTPAWSSGRRNERASERERRNVEHCALSPLHPPRTPSAARVSQSCRATPFGKTPRDNEPARSVLTGFAGQQEARFFLQIGSTKDLRPDWKDLSFVTWGNKEFLDTL